MKKALWIVISLVAAFLAFFVFTDKAIAATNISATTTDHWAWNDAIGWIDHYNTDSIVVSSQQLSGYASSSAGDISLDCATTRGGNVCSGANGNYKVTNNGGGNLSGWGWNDVYGWISFDCHNTTSTCSTYEVLINPTTGNFSNYAWNDIVGWISFCGNTGGVGGCSQVQAGNEYKVNTSWVATSTTGTLDSSVYDTGVPSGAQLNSTLWHGNQPADTYVRFQFATSNATSGPWTFVGNDGTTNTYYEISKDISSRLNYTAHNNKRYFRYRVMLVSNQSQTQTPRVDEVIISWSP